jgi:hypothetical protein
MPLKVAVSVCAEALVKENAKIGINSHGMRLIQLDTEDSLGLL